ncbi:hypothetical protein UMM65_05680 [Aureibaculum sp. 2210JD6-5]|uniref:hypothetical protein n=1 Tax=Aureibaculum sp. 2210JD6-5 TaxID=3103957 RepID=UPI002AAD489B|nr:hypothetical protein [Aureibaculum sp. 2210JD6-5]MDY7394723.1 hypothetical protein [Aureibaculum sp. 2210JD6-5]
MNVLSKSLTTAFKSSLLASVLFVLGIYSVEDTPIIIVEIIPALLIVCVITFTISTIAIWVTILPFYYLSSDKLELKFKVYFPFYATLFFSICFIMAISIDFIIGSLIFGIAYITAMFAWIWFFKPDKNEK